MTRFNLLSFETSRSTPRLSFVNRLSLAIVLSLTPSAVLFGQATAVVQISGTVEDPNGAAVANAEVKATQTSTNFVRVATTGPDGAYALSSLPIGPYEIEVSVAGFKTFRQQGVVLQVNNNPVLNIRLELGSVSQQIEVVANANMVEAQTTGVSQVIDQRRVVDLPLNGRQPTQLVLLSGAAVTAPPSDLASSKNYATSTTISVAGGQANGTYYLLDGGDHNDAFGAINLPLPFPDVLQEFSVQTNAVPAAYGVRAGAVVNAVTKSGTNAVHGDLFEFLRTGATNARNFFAPTVDALKRNQFGGTVGGPVVPDKLFFFGGYQGTRIRTAPPTNAVFVPTAAALAGDFSTLNSSLCGTPRTLVDPRGGIFPGNRVDVSRFSPQALAFLKYVPTSSDPCGRLQLAIPNNSDEDQLLVRSDWNQSDRHTIFGRYFFTDLRNPAVFNDNNLLLTTRPGVLNRVQSLVLGDTYSLTPHAINSLHGAWIREHITRGPADNLPTSSDIGLNVAPSPGNFPQIFVSSKFNTFCGTCSLARVFTSSFQVADDLEISLGNHQLSFGVDWIHRRLDFQVSTQQNPEFDFTGQITNDPLLDLLLGTPTNFIQGNLTRVNSYQNYFGFYANDKWRLSRGLTLTLGLRFEPFLVPYDTDGRATHFDLSSFAAGRRTTQFQSAPAGLFFPGDPGMPAAGANNRLANFAPRIGLAWDPAGDGRTSIRASYGILYDIPPLQYFDRFGFGPPWASAITIVSPQGGFANPYLGYPGGNPFPQPTPPPSNAVFPTGGQYANLPLNIRLPYMQQWNLSVQHQLGNDWLLSASYLGNKSTHRWLTTQQDYAVYLPGTCGSAPCSTIANTASRRILTRLNSQSGPAFSSLSQVDDGANASYHAVLLSANHRLSHNFSVLVNYTWSHCISDGDVQSEITGGYQNPASRAADRGNCVIDVRHLFNASLVMLSPRFHNRTAQTILGDWNLSPIITKRSGLWFTPSAGRDNSLSAVGADRLNVVGDPHAVDPSIARWFNTAAFAANAPGTFGNAGRASLEGPGAFNIDVALVRKIRIWENTNLEIRAEAFNLLNHANFANPRSSLNDVNFGRVLTANDPRILQFAMKYVF